MLDHPVCNNGIFNASEAQLYSLLLDITGTVFVALAYLEGEVIVGGAHSKAWPEPDMLVFLQKQNASGIGYPAMWQICLPTPCQTWPAPVLSQKFVPRLLPS